MSHCRTTALFPSTLEAENGIRFSGPPWNFLPDLLYKHLNCKSTSCPHPLSDILFLYRYSRIFWFTENCHMSIRTTKLTHSSLWIQHLAKPYTILGKLLLWYMHHLSVLFWNFHLCYYNKMYMKIHLTHFLFDRKILGLFEIFYIYFVIILRSMILLRRLLPHSL